VPARALFHTAPRCVEIRELPTPRRAAGEVIACSIAPGVAVFGATLTPYGGSGSSTPDGEAARQHVNDWIRSSGAFDAVLDFDAVWRDPGDPARVAAGFDLVRLTRGVWASSGEGGVPIPARFPRSLY
jgi:hypothetical protein